MTTEGSLVLAARDVHKRYHHHEVLRGVDVALSRGEVKALIGGSGSGKSTFLRCLALLEPIDVGEIHLDGERIGVRVRNGRVLRARERDLCAHRSEIGMVFQRFNLFPHMTATENVMCGLVEVRRANRSDARAQAEEILCRVGLAERRHAYPAELSGGQQQRVAIARALVMRPKVMLFDEPTSALDAELVNEVLDVIEDLASQGMTMLIVTHELSFARRVSDEVCLMDQGRIVEAAHPRMFFADPQHERSRAFLRAIGSMHSP